ncbi:MAG: hypothetical protein IPL59_18270 [Candidatus Competibacteraceae bacterium]|nr:hypothetical protein [Candidatus Competibacteraceae bacterium]
MRLSGNRAALSLSASVMGAVAKKGGCRGLGRCVAAVAPFRGSAPKETGAGSLARGRKAAASIVSSAPPLSPPPRHPLCGGAVAPGAARSTPFGESGDSVTRSLAFPGGLRPSLRARDS